MTELLTRLAEARRGASPRGIYSVCSAHPWVIEAAIKQAEEDATPLLIEATSNQVDQFGGYTGMKPKDFRRFVIEIAARCGFPAERLIFGGDHLGPNTWRNGPAEEAMRHAEGLIDAYVAAGFEKIHLDTSMPCGGDPPRLGDQVVAARAARLARVAEAAAGKTGVQPVYVIGTEVPTPGGATEALHGVEVTGREAARQTLEVHRAAFAEAGLEAVWSRVVALVVQPGVEFDHASVADYRPDKAVDLKGLLDQAPGLVFEAHSTDYQRPEALRSLVADGFAILKVGPALTFALREALFALAAIERALVAPESQSRLPEVIERVMLDKPERWRGHYHGSEAEQRLLRVYSYSDRMRYYWGEAPIREAVERLLANLEASGVPENVLSQHLPDQYRALRAGRLQPLPTAIVLDKVRDTLRPYARACFG